MQAALEAAVQRHTFPKANVDVYCLILESGGADAAVAITAASLAIADAGMEMYDLVSACRVVRVVRARQYISTPAQLSSCRKAS